MSEPPPPFRPLPVKAMNALGRALAPLGLRLGGRLEREALLARARRATGCEDYGDPGFREPLRILLDSLERDAKLTTLGRIFATRQVMECLTNRLRMVEYRRQHPEVDAEEVKGPIFVLGLPRTGTTLLQGLLAQDPAHRAPLSWETDDPRTPATPQTLDSDPRIAATEKRFAQLRQLSPNFQLVHPIGAEMPQECIVITAHDFWGVRFEMCFDVASYQEWMHGADARGAYRFHRWMLQHLQSGGVRGRWVLKTPGHLGTLDALLDVYPDARIIQLHRDPLKVVPSVASLEYTIRSISTDGQDPAALGRQNLRTWSLFLERAIEVRDARPEHARQFLDVPYQELLGDPIGCVRSVYAHFGDELSPEAEACMKSYMADNPQHKHGKHKYSLEMFGLDAAAVKRAFEAYTSRHDITPEG